MIRRVVPFIGILLGCGNAQMQLPDPSRDIHDGAAKGASASMMASPDQSSRMELPTGATLLVPQGAVGGAVEIRMQRPSDAQALELVKSLPPGKQLASAPYVLTPHGQEFAEPVELKLPIESGSTGSLAVAYLEDEDDKDWTLLGAPEISGSEATLKLEHFSVWLLVHDDGSKMSAGVGDGPSDSDSDSDTDEADGAPNDDDDGADDGPKMSAGSGEAPSDPGSDTDSDTDEADGAPNDADDNGKSGGGIGSGSDSVPSS